MSSSLRPSPRAETKQEVFRVLKEHDRGFRASQLTELVDVTVTQSQITRVLSSMQRKGLVEKSKDPTDRRRVIYRATEKLQSVPHYTAHDVKHYFSGGYSTIHHHHNGEKHSFPVHRLVAVAEHGVEAVENKHIHHKNKHPLDNSPENLVPLDVPFHKKADQLASLKMATTDEEFERLLELAEAADV
jgi:predicted transcriptional regulator